MAEYLIQDTTLTSLADKIRVLSGADETMSPSVMTDNVQSANNEVDNQAELLAQAIAALEGKASGGSGVSLPTLNNPASESEVFSGCEYIDESGAAKTGSFTIDSELDEQSDAISQIRTALAGKAVATPVLQDKTATPSTSSQTIVADDGYDGLSKVTVDGDANLVAGNIKSGVSIFGVSGSYQGSGSSSGGGSVEICTGTVNVDRPNDEDFIIYAVNENLEVYTTTLDAMMGGTFTVAKGTIFAITPWTSMSIESGGCIKYFGTYDGGTYSVSSDFTITYA